MELTTDVLNTICERDNEKINCYLQIIEFNIDKEKEKIWLSDGIYKMNFFMLESVNNQIKNTCKKGDIINCIVLYSSKLNNSVIIKFVKTNSEDLEIIGKPFPIEKSEDALKY